MFTRRFLLAALALAVLLPLTGCNGCRRHCNSSSGSFAPPPCCPDRGALPPGVLPNPNP